MHIELKKQINKKSIARIAAIQTIYQFDNDNNPSNIDKLLIKIREFYKSKDLKSDYELSSINKIELRPSYTYLYELVKLTHMHLKKIDLVIENLLIDKWKLKNLAKLLCTILRVGICELKYFPKTPSKVIINEYTDIANEMLDMETVGFVNSILDKYASNLR